MATRLTPVSAKRTAQGEQQPTAVPGKPPRCKTISRGEAGSAASFRQRRSSRNTEARAPAPKNANPAVPASRRCATRRAGSSQSERAQAAAGLAPGRFRRRKLERRKKIAENPAASNETVVLPVQNGAAVLDSDKDAARRGHHEGGRNGAQGQMGQGQMGQGQIGRWPGLKETLVRPCVIRNAQAQQAPVNVTAPTPMPTRSAGREMGSAGRSRSKP